MSNELTEAELEHMVNICEYNTYMHADVLIQQPGTVVKLVAEIRRLRSELEHVTKELEGQLASAEFSKDLLLRAAKGWKIQAEVYAEACDKIPDLERQIRELKFGKLSYYGDHR